MKNVIYFLFVWILLGTFLGLVSVLGITLIDNISFKEAMRLYDIVPSLILLFQVTGFLGTLFTTWFFLSKEQIGFWDIGLKFESVESIWYGLGFGVSPILLISLILYIKEGVTYSLNDYSLFNILIYCAVLIIGAINEEILIRGYVLRYLMKSKTKLFSLLVSSLIFSFFHVFNDNFSFLSFLNIFLAGIFLGIFYIYFKNLWFSISAHFAWNFFQGPILGSPISGQKTEHILKQILQGSEFITGGKFGFEASIICTVVLIIFLYFLNLFCKGYRYPLRKQVV